MRPPRPAATPSPRALGPSVRRDLASRPDVERMVRDFYRDVATDDLLGPVFAAARVDWPGHIETLTDFWCWQLFGERGYDGNPLRAHVPVHARTPFTEAHFARWLERFEDTVDAGYAGPVAEQAKVRARKMAQALQRLLAGWSESGDVAIEPTLVRRCPRPARS